MEVWDGALNAIGVDAESDLRGADKVYYPLALHIAPSTAPLPPNPSFASSVPKSTTTSTTMPASGKEKEQPTLTLVVELEPEEVAKVEQLKRKKKDRERGRSVTLPSTKADFVMD